MKRSTQAASVFLLLSQCAASWGNPWDQDMVDQPIAKAQRSLAPAEPDAIPIGGTETLPAPTTEAGMFDAKDDAATLQNPIPATPESVAEGQYLFELTCLVCHGAEGRGDGLVGLLLETAPVDMHDAYTQDQTDGQIFFTITRGRVTMPFYRDALSQEERWHVINYIRAEFGSE